MPDSPDQPLPNPQPDEVARRGQRVEGQTLTPDDLLQLLTNLPPDSKIELTKLPTGEITVSQDTPPKTKADYINEDPKLRALKGQPIALPEASERYGIPKTTLFNWKSSEFVTVLKDDGYRVYLDEADVAYCARVYQQRKASGFSSRGVRLLDEHGAPYKLKHEALARSRRQRPKKVQANGV
jgi:hypothetical protein